MLNKALESLGYVESDGLYVKGDITVRVDGETLTVKKATRRGPNSSAAQNLIYALSQGVLEDVDITLAAPPLLDKSDMLSQIVQLIVVDNTEDVTQLPEEIGDDTWPMN